jgi:hypothetical protein
MATTDVYVFSHGDPGLVERYGDESKPRLLKRNVDPRLRYIASVIGGHPYFAVVEVNQLSEVPPLLALLGLRSETATPVRQFTPDSLRHSRYYPHSVFIRVWTEDPGAAAQVFTRIGQMDGVVAAATVHGAIDGVVDVGGKTPAELVRRVNAVLADPGVRRGDQLRVTDSAFRERPRAARK